MTDRELNIALREMARSTGLCDEWYGKWRDDDSIDMCLERYVKGHDFAIKNDWPPLGFIRKNFRLEDLHRHNIYLDEEVDLRGAQSGYYIFLGDCKGSLETHGYSVVTCYLRHNSKVDVTSLGSAKTFVSLYEDSDGEFCKGEWGRLRVYDRRKKEGD